MHGEASMGGEQGRNQQMCFHQKSFDFLPDQLPGSSTVVLHRRTQPSLTCCWLTEAEWMKQADLPSSSGSAWIFCWNTCAAFCCAGGRGSRSKHNNGKRLLLSNIHLLSPLTCGFWVFRHFTVIRTEQKSAWFMQVFQSVFFLHLFKWVKSAKGGWDLRRSKDCPPVGSEHWQSGPHCSPPMMHRCSPPQTEQPSHSGSELQRPTCSRSVKVWK